VGLKYFCTAVYKFVALPDHGCHRENETTFFSDFTENELAKAAHLWNLNYLKHITSAI
jgi:hypothetical protein